MISASEGHVCACFKGRSVYGLQLVMNSLVQRLLRKFLPVQEKFRMRGRLILPTLCSCEGYWDSDPSSGSGLRMVELKYLCRGMISLSPKKPLGTPWCPPGFTQLTHGTFFHLERAGSMAWLAQETGMHCLSCQQCVRTK